MVVLYAVLMLIGAVSSSVKLFLLARLLTKNDFGEYSYINSIVMYAAPFVTFGLIEGMSRRFPILLGEGRTADAYKLRNEAFRAAAMMAALLTLAALLVSGALQNILSRPLFFVTVLIAGEIWAYNAFLWGVRDLRSHLRTTSYAAVMCCKGIAEVAVIFYLAPRYGYVGVLLSEIVVWSVAAVIVFTKAMREVSFREGSIRSVVPLILEGAALSLAGILANTARLSDRLILGAFLPKSDYADYAFHLLVISAGAVAANVLNQYFWPRALHLYGSSGSDPAVVDRYLRRLTLGLTALGLAAAPVVPFAFQFATTHFFPTYHVNTILLLFLYGAAVFDVANFYPYFLLTVGKTDWFIAIHIAGAAVLAVGTFAVIFLKANLIFVGALAFLTRVLILIGTAVATHKLVARHVSLKVDEPLFE